MIPPIERSRYEFYGPTFFTEANRKAAEFALLDGITMFMNAGYELDRIIDTVKFMYGHNLDEWRRIQNWNV